MKDDRDRAARWLQDNASAIADANATIDAKGLPLAAHAAIIATPLRIQDVLRDAEPLEWEMQPGGAFTARPRDGIKIHVAPSSDRGWTWSIDGDAGTSYGTASGCVPWRGVTEAATGMSPRLGTALLRSQGRRSVDILRLA